MKYFLKGILKSLIIIFILPFWFLFLYFDVFVVIGGGEPVALKMLNNLLDF